MEEQGKLLEKYWDKITAYCAFRERSRKEALDKLQSYEGIGPEVIETFMERLENESFLNEKRFAEVYARGKFNSRSWGKLKISQALKFKGVGEEEIQNALDKIEDEEYIKAALKLAEKKAGKLDLTHQRDRSKLIAHLASKGYEYDVAYRLLREMN